MSQIRRDRICLAGSPLTVRLVLFSSPSSPILSLFPLRLFYLTYLHFLFFISCTLQIAYRLETGSLLGHIIVSLIPYEHSFD